MDDSLKNKRALVTAGANGIGLEIARKLSGSGARVMVCDVSVDAIEKLAHSDPQLEVFNADVSSEKQVQKLFHHVDSVFGGLDILVNNAGIAGPTGRTDTLEFSDWKRTLDINISGQFLCAKAAIPHLLTGVNPVMVNMSSIAGHMGVAGRTPYVASKWAVVGFTKSLALELGPEGVRVNAVLPGIVQGPRIDAVIEARARMQGESIENMTNLYTQDVSLGRMVKAGDIANMVRFLCSNEAANVHGQALVVDGYTPVLR